MTWLYVPSLSAPASEASTLASASLDPTRAALLSWRGKPQPPQAWLRAWKRGGFIRLLSGLTCEPSTLAHGAAQWIASCRAIHAKETASLESGLALPTTDGCSIAPSRYSTKAGLRPSSARTSLGISTASSPLQSHHWSDWAAALRSEYSARPRRERATDASGSSSWPTVSARDGDARRAPTDPNSPAWANKVARGAVNAAGLLSDDLSSSAVAWRPLPMGETWATPTARMHKGGGEAVTRADGKSRLDMLDWQAEAWSTPRASDGEKGGPNMTFGAGGTPPPTQAAHWLPSAKGVRAFAMTDLSLPDRPTPSGPRSSETRRRLNPLFVEWLMGWPEGLSGFDTAATASCRSPQPSHGCGCMDCWLTTQRAMLFDLLTIEPPAQGLLL